MNKVLNALLALAVMLVLFGCGEAVSSDGTVTVSLTGDTIEGAHGLYAYAYIAGETALDTPSSVVSCGWHQVFGGATSFTLMVDDGDFEPTSTVWTGIGGVSYDIYIHTANDGGTPGDSDYMTDPYPLVISINGPQSINLDFSEMVPYDGPSSDPTPL